MKELSIEEKAQRYDEALKEAVVAYKDEDKHLKATLERIFPELEENKESEDDKIRKEIINYLRGRKSNETYGETVIKYIRWIEWLEKQGEKDEEILILKDQIESLHAARKALKEVHKIELEKQGEQKPTYKVEPMFKVKYAGSEYNVLKVRDIAGVTYYGIEDEPNHIDYVQAENCEIIDGYGIKKNGCSFPTKPIMFSEQNPAWSEEDEKIVNDLLWIIEAYRKNSFNETHKYMADKSENWLKSIKDRV